MGSKDAHSEKKQIQVSLRRPGTTPTLSSNPPKPIQSKRVVGILKTDFSTPILEAAPAPEIQLDATTSLELAAFAQRERQRITDALNAHKASELNLLSHELSVIRQQRLDEINQEIIEIKQAAIQSGRQEGLEKAEKSYTQKLSNLIAMINDVAENKSQFLKKSEPELLKLAIKIAEHLIQKSIELDNDTVMSIVTTAMRRVTDKDKVIIKVSPADADLIRKKRDLILEKMPDIRALEIHDDPRLEDGGCIIETRLGYIDASLKTGIESVKTALFGVLSDTHEIP